MSEYTKNISDKVVVDIEKDRYPYSIVWTTLPCISICCPCIGHTGNNS